MYTGAEKYYDSSKIFYTFLHVKFRHAIVEAQYIRKKCKNTLTKYYLMYT